MCMFGKYITIAFHPHLLPFQAATFCVHSIQWLPEILLWRMFRLHNAIRNAKLNFCFFNTVCDFDNSQNIEDDMMYYIVQTGRSSDKFSNNFFFRVLSSWTPIFRARHVSLSENSELVAFEVE